MELHKMSLPKPYRLLVLAIASLYAVPALAEDTPTTLPNCIAMSRPIDLFNFVMTDDGPVYFCCPRCRGRFEKDPAKFQAKAVAQRDALAKLPRVQVKCPVSADPVVQQVSTQHDGQKVLFCAEKCMVSYKVDPAKFRGALLASYSYQTRCPVEGEPIDPKAFTTLSTGQTIYFCCPPCQSTLLADPAKYDDKLREQGIRIQWDRVKDPAAGDDQE